MQLLYCQKHHACRAVCRQLPLLAAMLQGRVNYKWGEFKHRNHLLLYTHVLGVLELLQPLVFHKQYSEPFSHVVAAYMQLIKVSAAVISVSCWLACLAVACIYMYMYLDMYMYMIVGSLCASVKCTCRFYM